MRLQAAKASDGKVNAIWVDTDGCVSAAEYCDVLLTSRQKGMDVAVDDGHQGRRRRHVQQRAVYVGTLANNGIGLAPYHDVDSKIPPSVKAEMDQLKQQIIDGKIKVSR